jgi:hypothetical protein
MPSILHVLRVDQYQYQNDKNDRNGANDANDANGANGGNKGGNRNRSKEVAVNHLLSKNNGGMNWGTIAIYNCSVSCEGSRTSSDSIGTSTGMHDDGNDAGDIISSGSVKSEFVIVQESADGNPEEREWKK